MAAPPQTPGHLLRCAQFKATQQMSHKLLFHSAEDDELLALTMNQFLDLPGGSVLESEAAAASAAAAAAAAPATPPSSSDAAARLSMPTAPLASHGLETKKKETYDAFNGGKMGDFSAVPPQAAAAPRTDAYLNSGIPSTWGANMGSAAYDARSVQVLQLQVQNLLRQLWEESQKHQQALIQEQERSHLMLIQEQERFQRALQEQIWQAEQRELALRDAYEQELLKLRTELQRRPAPDHDNQQRHYAAARPVAGPSSGPFVAGASGSARGAPVLSLAHPLIQDRDRQIERLEQEVEALRTEVQRDRQTFGMPAGRRRETAQAVPMLGGGLGMVGGDEYAPHGSQLLDAFMNLTTEKAALQQKYESIKRKALLLKSKELKHENVRFAFNSVMSD